jgi:1A family penicillin-binding protein
MRDKLTGVIQAHRTWFVAAIVAMSLAIWGVVAMSFWVARDLLTDLPDEEVLRGIGTMAQSTSLLDGDDRPVFTIYQEQRIEVPLRAVSPHVIRAFVAVEDQRFYDHRGIDVVRVAGAAVANMRQGRAAQGASTLTQQLARQSFLTPEKTIRRKLKEMIVAARLERAFTKDEILELYVNKVYFGDGLYGVEAASLGYFGKHAADLDVAEAALLAGLVQAPSLHAPTISLERAVARRRVVLQTMRDSGAIDAAGYQAAVDAPVVLHDALRAEESYGQYFREEVRRQLVDRFGWERVYQGGLRVYTTIDLEAQKAAEAEVAASLAAIEERRAQGRRETDEPAADEAPLQGALLAMDPRTGEVRAMVGGRSFEESSFNRAVQARRQPGSAFKPFIYAAALERGFSPATLLTGLDEPIDTPEGAWVPEDEQWRESSVTMRTALRTSSNRAAVRMIEEVGIPAAVQYAERLGLSSMPAVPSLALGSGEVTLMQMTAAYAAFATGGLRPEPTLIRRVETAQGEVLYEWTPSIERVMSEPTAFLMTSMMADVITAGTANRARREGFTRPAAGKTGTTNSYRDVWFAGYTPQLVATVWLGYDQPRTILARGGAGELAVPLWARFMRAATADHEVESFRRPSEVISVQICRLSGRRATDACREVVSVEDGSITERTLAYMEHFVRGTEPHDDCPFHRVPDGTLLVHAIDQAPAAAPVLTAAGADEGSAALATGTEPAAAPAADGRAEAVEGEPEEERRGFWSRVFGRRR